jgi:hypothetical protein
MSLPRVVVALLAAAVIALLTSYGVGAIGSEPEPAPPRDPIVLTTPEPSPEPTNRPTARPDAKPTPTDRLECDDDPDDDEDGMVVVRPCPEDIGDDDDDDDRGEDERDDPGDG